MERDERRTPIIIIRRPRREEHGGHGGAWKVAFADFMTAMMAFFLVLWIVNSTTKDARAVIARYFNPLQIADTTQTRKGVKSPNDFELDRELTSPETNARQSRPSGEQQNPVDPARDPKYKLIPGQDADPFVLLDDLAERARGEMAAEGLVASADQDSGLDGAVPFRDMFAPSAPTVPPPVNAKPAKKAVEKSTANGPAARGDRSPGQEAALEALREDIGQALKEAGIAKETHLSVTRVDEGVLISLMDDARFGMFAIGSPEPQPRAVQAMAKIGQIISTQPGKIVVRGHTDARPYKTRAYDNWRLSTARAQMAAYMLMRGAPVEKRIERIEGHADHQLRNAGDPLAAENRRIEILLRTP